MKEHTTSSEIVLSESSVAAQSHELMVHAEAQKLRLLWDCRRFLWRFIVIGLAVSVVIAFLIPSRYTSTVRLMPPDSGSGAGLATVASMFAGGSNAMTSGLGEIAGDLMGLKSSSDIFVGILGSRTTEDKLIEEFNLRKVYWDRKMEDARKDLKDRTSVDVDRKSQIITISVTDRSPKRAAEMAQAYISELDLLVAQLSTSSARRERIFLEGRLKEVSADLTTAERDFSQFASKNTTIDIKEQGKAMVDAAAQLEGELIGTESELQGLKQIYSDNNVRVRSLSARVAELQNQLEKLGGRDADLSPSQDQSGISMYPSIRKLPLLGVRYADLYRRTMVQEAVFETLTKQYELAKVQEAKEIPTVKVLDPPNIPEKKSYPPRVVIILLGTAFALVLGVTSIFLRGLWDATGADDPRKILVTDMYQTLTVRMPWLLRNGSGASSNGLSRKS